MADSTQTELKIVQGSNFQNTIISLDGNNGEANIGGQHVDGRAKVNTANNVTIFDVNARSGYIKVADLNGQTLGVFDCRPNSRGFYIVGQIHDGHTAASLDAMFPSE